MVLSASTQQVDVAMRRDYAAWVAQTNSCNACAGCSNNYLCNENIRVKAFPSSDERIVPLAGFLGDNYEQHRVLVLGKNGGGGLNFDACEEPRGKKHLAIHNTLYGCQRRISQSAGSTRILQVLDMEAPRLIASARKWRITQNLALREVTGLELENIAYANQILCQSYPAAIGEIEKSFPDDLKNIYRTCILSRGLELIRILRPKHIIALGKKRSNSWPEQLKKLLIEDGLVIYADRVQGVCFPFGRHIHTTHKDLTALRDMLGIITPVSE